MALSALREGAGADAIRLIDVLWLDTPNQTVRAAFQRIGELAVRFIPYSALAEHRATMTRFGTGIKAIDAIARAL